MTNFINEKAWDELNQQFSVAQPFNHIIIDDFWQDDIAQELVGDFPDYESPIWTAHYQNAIEDKKAATIGITFLPRPIGHLPI